MKRRSRLATAFACALFGLAPIPALAVDGVKLLRQPIGDAFPLTLNAPGSYRLKGNLTVPDANTTAIVVSADHVTIDLNGFSIAGVTVCSGQPVTGCTPTGSGIGIDASGHRGITVKNGVVRGMGSVGILIPSGSVENVQALSNGGDGISTYVVPVLLPRASVRNVEANSNGGFGIREVDTATDSRASFNSGTGVNALFNASNCYASLNGGRGIQGCTAGVISDSMAFGNALIGLDAFLVVNSSAVNNTGRGVYAGAATGCIVSNNGNPQLLAVGIAGHNLCPGGTPCP